MENAGYLFAAFSIIWAFVFGYVHALFIKQRKLQKEIELLKEAFNEKGIEQ